MDDDSEEGLGQGQSAGSTYRTKAEKAAAARSQRAHLDSEIEFVGDFDIVKAYGVDLSAEGICFELDESLLFEMRFTHQGKTEQHRARLVWAKNVENGRSRLGFRFVPA